MPLPAPPVTPGLTWRPWASDDVAELARHMMQVRAAEGLDWATGPETYRWLLGQEGFDPAADSLVAIDADGSVRAEATVWALPSEAGLRVFLWIAAAPPHTALRPFLIEWATARADQHLDGADPGHERLMRLSVEAHRTGFHEELRQAGYTAERSFVVMRRHLADLPTPASLPGDVMVRTWQGDHDEAVRLASNEAFSDHWGSLPIGTGHWRSMYLESETFRPDLSFVATVGNDVVSFCLVEVSADDNAHRAHPEMYVDRVGTRRSWRGLGIASHLLVRSMESARAAGFEVAALDVDETSHTGATEVYRRLGFAVEEASLQFVRRR